MRDRVTPPSGGAMKRMFGIPYAPVVCGLVLVACGGGLGREDYAEAYSEALCHWQARCGEIRDEEDAGPGMC